MQKMFVLYYEFMTVLLGCFCLQKQAVKKDVYQVFAEKVRDHKELVSRWAVLQETRVEYFRGKDFVNFLKNHPEVKDILESDRNLETEDIANILLGKNLLVRCDRVVKTLRPGKKKLSTWPAHLEIFPVSNFSCCIRCVAICKVTFVLICRSL
jgi:translocation protein SEC62